MKHKTLTLMLTMLMSMTASVASAYDALIDGIYYNFSVSYATVTYKNTSYNSYSGNVVIPETVTYKNTTYSVAKIGERAFDTCSGLTSVVIGSNVKEISDYAFNYCSNLTSISIPSTTTSIGQDAFSGCSSMTEITIDPNNPVYDSRNNCNAIIETATNTLVTGCKGTVIPEDVTTIGFAAYSGQKTMTSLTIPKSITYIDNYAITNCTNLTSIYCYNVNPPIFLPKGIGTTQYENIIIYVPTGCKSSYQNADTWKNFKDIRENIPVTSITLNYDSYTLNRIGKSVQLVATVLPENAANKKVTWKSFNEAVCVVTDGLVVATGEGTTVVSATTADGEHVAYCSIKVELIKCATPTITYKNGKLTFASDTEGVQFVSSITDTDIKAYNTAEIDLSVTYTIRVHATFPDYYDSEEAVATLCWIEVEPKTEGVETAVKEMSALPVLIQSNNGTLHITGAEEGSPVSVYTTSGQLLGTSMVHGNEAIVGTNLHDGIAVVKIGNRAVKVLIK